MAHWWQAIVFTTSITAYAAVMFILFAFAIHAHRRILIMLDTGYYWKDAGQILRREKRKQHGTRPGQHRPRPRAQATILAIRNQPPWEDPPEPDIVDALHMVPETDLLVPGEWIPRTDTAPMGTDLPATQTIELGAQK